MKSSRLLRRLLLLYSLTTAGTIVAQFTEAAVQLGIDHHTYDPTGMAGGVAVFDYNNDGWPDIYLTGGLAPDRLYENRKNGTFEDVTKSSRITAFNVVPTVGVAAGDFDGDGYVDLFVTTASDHPNYLLHNVGGTYFEDRSRAAGITHPSWSTSAALSDYDGDGDLDIYVANYVAYDDLPFEENITAAEPNFLYRNDGNLRFTLVDNPQLAGTGCTLAATFSDYNGDGLQDLFVLNDFGDFYQPNQLHTNRRGEWIDSTREKGFLAAINAMGIAGGDLDEDGDLDYYVTNIDDNLCYINEGDRFSSLARDLEIQVGSGSSWGTTIQDFDNDGHLDLYVNRGYLYALDIAQFNRLYYGSGRKLSFTDDSRQLVVPGVANKARGVAYGDFNRDGALDLVVNGVRLEENHGARSLLYLGAASGNYVKLKLAGPQVHRAYAGTRATLHSDSLSMMREFNLGGSYLSTSEHLLHFGLGSRLTIDSIVISWPQSGERSVIRGPSINQTYLVTRDQLTTTPAGATPLSERATLYPNPASDRFALKLSDSAPLPDVLTLVAADGRVVHTRSVSSRKDLTLTDLRHYPRGMYTVIIKSKDQATALSVALIR